MSFSFDVRRGLVIIQVEVSGPSGSAILSFALDTGATATLINQSRMMQLAMIPQPNPTDSKSQHEAESNLFHKSQ